MKPNGSNRNFIEVPVNGALVALSKFCFPQQIVFSLHDGTASMIKF